MSLKQDIEKGVALNIQKPFIQRVGIKLNRGKKQRKEFEINRQ